MRSELSATISNINQKISLDSGFKLLKKISQISETKDRLDLIYRLMEKRSFLPDNLTPIINELLMQAGCNQSYPLP